MQLPLVVIYNDNLPVGPFIELVEGSDLYPDYQIADRIYYIHCSQKDTIASVKQAYGLWETETRTTITQRLGPIEYKGRILNDDQVLGSIVFDRDMLLLGLLAKVRTCCSIL